MIFSYEVIKVNLKKLKTAQIMKYYFVLLSMLIFFSCSTEKHFHRVDVEKNRYNSLFSEEKSFVLKGKALFKTNYCLGAKPPNNWRETQPFSIVKNTTLVFKKVNETGGYFSVKTDRSGLFIIPLYEGVWRYYLTESFKENNAPNIEDIPKNCDKFYNMPYGTIEIKKEMDSDTVYFNDISFNKEIKSMRDTTKTDSIFFYLPCNPCDLSVKP